MAANRPRAVATSASAMPGATCASVACCTLARPRKACMMPHTVPNRPTYGLTEPVVARNDRRRSSWSISRWKVARMARRAPSTMSPVSEPRWFLSLANSRKPASKMRSRLPMVCRLLTAPWYRRLRSLPPQNSRSKLSVCRRARPMANHLLKMNSHDMNDTTASSAITPLTTGLAPRMSTQMSRSVVTFTASAGEPRGERRGQGSGLEIVAAHARRLDHRLGHRFLGAQRALPQAKVGVLAFHDFHGDAQRVVQPRAAQEIDLRAPHDELQPVLGGQALLVDAEAAQPLGARALEIAQVVGIVDDAAEIGVLVVHPHRPGEHARGIVVHRPIVVRRGA